MKKIVVIPGDGIGPEIVEATLRILEEVGFHAEWDYQMAGLCAFEKEGVAVPDQTLEAIRQVGTVLKGPTTTPNSRGHRSANVQIRKALDLFANVRPIHTIPGLACPIGKKNLDLIIVRENTEDLYAGIEFQPHPDMAQAVKVVSRPGCYRIADYTFKMARLQGRKKVTAVHKANIMKLSDGLFLEEFYRVAKQYPEIEANEIIIDNCCMQLVSRPEQFDILVTLNLYGDIISDLGAGLIGGLGLAPSGNIGEKCALFEAVHGSAPDIAQKGVANPMALLLSGTMMLRHLGEMEKADQIYKAMVEVCQDISLLTPDLGGKASTPEYVKNIISRLK